MSRSVIGSVSPSPARRARDARSDDTTPATTGPASRPSDHSAATPIAPAPTKRTSLRNTVPARVATSAVAGWNDESNGTNTPHASTMPASIATPTVTPTRWPTPTSASESPMSRPVTDAPARK